jgi:GT2 family glycosyltransferase
VKVTVVVPHYEDPHGLDLVLTALELQDHPTLEVVVADDGSEVLPDPGARAHPVRVVSQPDQGFRAAAARNLGAAAAGGEVLCFLDADTVPEPGYVSAVVRAIADGADLVVGRRRHADLAATTPTELVRWFRDAGPAPREFEEPAWLRDAYDRTDDLRTAGDDAYRFVISAVLSVTRDLFERVGGFEEAFTAYGGEDWEFAHRCWTAGAEFVHAREAVAWHDGPDFAGRTDEAQARRSRNVEGLTLARFVPDPAARGEGLIWVHPDVVVTLDDRDHPVADVVLSIRSLLRDSDVGVWLRSGEAAQLLDDPRVHRGAPPQDVLRRCRFQVRLDRPVLLKGTTLRDLTDVAPARVGEHLLVLRSRDLARGARPPVEDVRGGRALAVVDADLQRTWGREAHQRHTSLRTPFLASDTPSARP